MSDLAERLRGQVGDDHVRGCQGRQYACSCGYDLATECLLEIAADRIEALEADVDRFVGQRDKALEFISANAHRIEALEAALNYVADMTYYGAGAEWHFKLGYDPQEVLAAIAPEPEK